MRTQIKQIRMFLQHHVTNTNMQSFRRLTCSVLVVRVMHYLLRLELILCTPKVGPSSSHTVGPMRAGSIFITDLTELGLLEKVHRVKINLYV